MAAKPKSEAAPTPPAAWDLRLYVSDWEPRSAEAWTNLHELCEQYLPGLYKIEVVDLTRAPHRSRTDQIIALPTVVRGSPLPEKRAIGRLTDRERVLDALELRAARDHAEGRNTHHPPERKKRGAAATGRPI